jgi:hypothetical protein
MTPHSLRSRLCLILAFLLSSGCNRAYRELLQSARQAADRGDFITAARFYRKACETAPDDETACGQAPIFAQKAVAHAVENARPACEAGELDRCMPPLLEAQELVPDHPEVTTLLEKASQLHMKHCARWKMDGPLDTAAAWLACLQSRGHQFSSPRYQSLLTESANHLASRFAELAVAAENEAASGAATVFWTSAQCLAHGADNSWRAQQAREEFLDSSSIPVIVYLGGAIPPQTANELSNLCQRISSKLPAWAQCTKPGTEGSQQGVLHLQVDAVIQEVQTNISKQRWSREFPSGTLLTQNPEHERREKQLQEAEAALQQALQQLEQAEKQPGSECETKALTLVKCDGCPLPTTKKRPCVETAAENAHHKLKVRDRLKAQLSTIPPKVEKVVYSTFNYTEKTHTWTSDFHFTIKTSTPSVTVPFRKKGELRFEDKEHPSHVDSKLDADPLEPPSSSAFAEAFLRELTPQVLEAVRLDGAVRSAARVAQCNELPADWSSTWVQCWAEASFWKSGDAPPADAFLQLLASHAGASQQVKCR